MTHMYSVRQSRVLVLEALERCVKQFRPREELWPLRVPRDPILLDTVVARAGPEAARALEWKTLRSRTLLHLEWMDGSRWTAWMMVLPSGVKLYCDSNGDETRLLASGGRNEGEDSDRAFLQLLSESAGRHFGIEMAGGAPSRVRSTIPDRGFLIELFVNLFEVTGAEDSVRDQLPLAERHGVDANGRDFRSDVENWLERAMRGDHHQ